MQACLLPGVDAPLYYSVQGNKSLPVLLCVHGVAESSAVWQPAIEQLSRTHCCIAVDLPGHGYSAGLRGNWSMHFYAQVLRQFMQQMQLHNVTLLAHSMGAQIAAVLALQVPAWINSMIWVAPAGVETFTADEANALKQFTAQHWQTPPSAEQAAAQFKVHFAHATGATGFLQKLAEYYAPERIADFREVVAGSVNGMLAEPVHAFLPQLRMPVYVLMGERDLLVPNRFLHPALTPQYILDEARKLLPNSKTTLAKNAGHFLPVEQPDVLAAAVQQLTL